MSTPGLYDPMTSLPGDVFAKPHEIFLVSEVAHPLPDIPASQRIVVHDFGPWCRELTAQMSSECEGVMQFLKVDPPYSVHPCFFHLLKNHLYYLGCVFFFFGKEGSVESLAWLCWVLLFDPRFAKGQAASVPVSR